MGPVGIFLVFVSGESEIVSGVMSNAMNRKLFKGFEINRGGTMISHLQYADDTLCMEKRGWIIFGLWRLCLEGFKWRRGKVNFYTSCLKGVNVPLRYMEMAWNFLKCKEWSISFVYLGLQIGAIKSDKLFNWEPLLEQLRMRLNSWRNKYVSLDKAWFFWIRFLTSIYFFWKCQQKFKRG